MEELIALVAAEALEVGALDGRAILRQSHHIKTGRALAHRLARNRLAIRG